MALGRHIGMNPMKAVYLDGQVEAQVARELEHGFKRRVASNSVLRLLEYQLLQKH